MLKSYKVYNQKTNEFSTEPLNTTNIIDAMILVCPNCDARYTLKPLALGAEGRDVRCAKCSHTWFQRAEDLERVNSPVDEMVGKAVENSVQDSVEKPVLISEELPPKEPDVEALLEEAFDDSQESIVEDVVEVDSIPNAVKPVKAVKTPKIKTPETVLAKLMGAFASFILVGAIIGGLVLMKDKVMSAWPPSQNLYKLVGLAPAEVSGGGLVIENVIASIHKTRDRTSVLIVQGRVINLTEKKQPLPDLIAQLRSTNGEDGDKWFVKTPMDTLAPNESFNFKSDYPNVPRGIGSVNVTFDVNM